MRNMLGLLKWVLLVGVVVIWFGLALANRSLSTSLVIIPGIIQFEQISMLWVLFFPLIILFVVFWLAGMIDQFDNFIEGREMKKRISELEQEVRQLRNLPIREGLRTNGALEEEKPL